MDLRRRNREKSILVARERDVGVGGRNSRTRREADFGGERKGDRDIGESFFRSQAFDGDASLDEFRGKEIRTVGIALGGEDGDLLDERAGAAVEVNFGEAGLFSEQSPSLKFLLTGGNHDRGRH